MGTVIPLMPTHFNTACQLALATCRVGWHPLGCNSTHPTLRSFGVRLHTVNCRRQLVRCVLVTRRWLLLLPFVISVSIWTLMFPWLHTSPPLLERVLRRCGRYAVCGVHYYRATPCWHWYVHR